MALTLANMRTQLSSMLTDLDNFHGESPSASQLTDLINYGIREVSQEIYQIDPSITLTLTADQQTYDLRDVTAPAVVSRKVLEPLVVIINGNPLWNAARSRYGLWSLGELQRYRPSWRADSSGTPTIAAFHDRTLYLHAKPNAAVVSGGSNYIMGRYLAADMVNSSDDNNYPDIPEELHEAVVKVAAIFAAEPTMVPGDGAIAKLATFDKRASDSIARIRRRNMRTAQDWGSTSGYQDRDIVYC